MRFMVSHWIRFIFRGLALLLLLISCEKTNLPPAAKFKISAYLADTLAVLEFDASACTDPEDDQLALFIRWDFQGDSIWDTDYSTQKVTGYRYRQQGLFHPVLEVKDQDDATDTLSLEILITDIMKVSKLTDERDGKTYKITLIEGTWWMSENLDYGKWILTPQGQEKNGIVEKYYYDNDSTQPVFKGGLYTWQEATGHSKSQLPRGICPEGWQLPDGEALAKLSNKCWLLHPISLLVGIGGFWNLDLAATGAYSLLYDYSFSKDMGTLDKGFWWTSEFSGSYSDNMPWIMEYEENSVYLDIYEAKYSRWLYYKHLAIPVRCVKKVH
jgi:uncharacterized protein (TIGR02145 family)